MSKQIIEALPEFRRMVPCIPGTELPIPPEDYLKVAEFFYDTIQGEGIHVGHPAAFLRLQGCTQSCVFCDTKEVWRFGNPYTFDELLNKINLTDLDDQFIRGAHLVLTGGSPLLQQQALINFIDRFIAEFKYKPYIEIENECTIMPDDEMICLVDCWNNSPKLGNSYNPRSFRYQPSILKTLSSLENSWFKFVVSLEEDWDEIRRDFIAPGLIAREQIILMPMGATREELLQNRQFVVDMAIRESVRYSTREHIILWDKKTGV